MLLLKHVTKYSNFILKRSRQVASGIMVGVKNEVESKFSSIHEMEENDSKPYALKSG